MCSGFSSRVQDERGDTLQYNNPQDERSDSWGLSQSMNVLLTGGYGCIGSWIARNLLERGDQVWIYDLKEDPKRLRLILPEEKIREIQFVQGDVTDLVRLRQVFENERISHVVHLAGLQVPTCP